MSLLRKSLLLTLWTWSRLF